MENAPPSVDIPEKITEADRRRLTKLGFKEFPTGRTDQRYWRETDDKPLIEEGTLIGVLIAEKKW